MWGIDGTHQASAQHPILDRYPCPGKSVALEECIHFNSKPHTWAHVSIQSKHIVGRYGGFVDRVQPLGAVIIKSSRERVFEAWTNPNQIQRWFGPATCKVVDVKIDLRVGGAYRFQVYNDPMGEMAVTGKYKEVSSPEKLVFTWKWEDDEAWENARAEILNALVAKCPE